MLHVHLVEYYSATEGIEFSYALQHKWTKTTMPEKKTKHKRKNIFL